METNQSVWNCVLQLLYRLQLLIRHIILVQIFWTSRWHRETRNAPVWWDSEKLGGRVFWVFFGTGHNRTRVYSASCETTMHRTYRNSTNSQRKPELERFLMGRNSLFVPVYQVLRFHCIFTSERFSTMCDGRVASGLSKQWFVDNAEILKHLRLKTEMIIHNYPILSVRLWKLFLNWCMYYI